MDLAFTLYLSKLLRQQSQKGEGFEGEERNEEITASEERELPEENKCATKAAAPRMSGFVSALITTIISLSAWFLSWNCMTLEGRNIFDKIFYSSLAAVFGTLYMVYFALFREPICWAALQKQSQRTYQTMYK